MKILRLLEETTPALRVGKVSTWFHLASLARRVNVSSFSFARSAVEKNSSSVDVGSSLYSDTFSPSSRSAYRRSTARMCRISSRTVFACAISIGKSSSFWFAASHSRQRCVSAKQKRSSSAALNTHRSLMPGSDIDGLAFYAAEAIEQRLIQRWMGVDSEHHLFYRGFELHRRDSFGDQFRCRRPDDVHAENLSVLLLRNDFDEALVVADDAGFRIRRERELADFYFVCLLARLCLSESYASDLWLAVGCPGNQIALHRTRILAGDLCDCNHTL